MPHKKTSFWDISANLSPALNAGRFDVRFGNFSVVDAATVQIDCSANTDSSAQFDASLGYNPTEGGSLNVVSVYMRYKDDRENSGNWKNATSTMLNGKRVVIFAQGH